MELKENWLKKGFVDEPIEDIENIVNSLDDIFIISK